MFCLQHEDLESSLRDSGVLAQTQKTEDLEVRKNKLYIINLISALYFIILFL